MKNNSSRIASAVLAFFIGILLIPILPALIAFFVYQEFDKWEER